MNVSNPFEFTIHRADKFICTLTLVVLFGSPTDSRNVAVWSVLCHRLLQEMISHQVLFLAQGVLSVCSANIYGDARRQCDPTQSLPQSHGCDVLKLWQSVLCLCGNPSLSGNFYFNESCVNWNVVIAKLTCSVFGCCVHDNVNVACSVPSNGGSSKGKHPQIEV